MGFEPGRAGAPENLPSRLTAGLSYPRFRSHLAFRLLRVRWFRPPFAISTLAWRARRFRFPFRNLVLVRCARARRWRFSFRNLGAELVFGGYVPHLVILASARCSLGVFYVLLIVGLLTTGFLPGRKKNQVNVFSVDETQIWQKRFCTTPPLLTTTCVCIRGAPLRISLCHLYTYAAWHI